MRRKARLKENEHLVSKVKRRRKKRGEREGRKKKSVTKRLLTEENFLEKKDGRRIKN